MESHLFIKNKVILWDSEKCVFLDEENKLMPTGAHGWELDFGAYRLSIPELSYKALVSWLKDGTINREAVAFFPAHVRLCEQEVSTIIRLSRIGQPNHAGKERLLLIADVNPFKNRVFDLISVDYQPCTITVLKHGQREIKNTLNPLTTDELLCIYESSSGNSIRSTASKLCWSEAKTKKIRKSIFTKLYVSNMSQAIQVNSIFSLVNFSNI